MRSTLLFFISCVCICIGFSSCSKSGDSPSNPSQDTTPVVIKSKQIKYITDTFFNVYNDGNYSVDTMFFYYKNDKIVLLQHGQQVTDSTLSQKFEYDADGRLIKCTGMQCILDYHEYGYNSHNYVSDYVFTYDSKGRLSDYTTTSIDSKFPPGTAGYYKSKHIFTYSTINDTLQVKVNLSWQDGTEKDSNNYILYYNNKNQLLKDNQVAKFVYDSTGNLIHWDVQFGWWHDYDRSSGPSFEYDYFRSIYGDFLMSSYFFMYLKVSPSVDAQYTSSIPQYTLFNSYEYDEDGNVTKILTKVGSIVGGGTMYIKHIYYN